MERKLKKTLDKLERKMEKLNPKSLQFKRLMKSYISKSKGIGQMSDKELLEKLGDKKNIHEKAW